MGPGWAGLGLSRAGLDVRVGLGNSKWHSIWVSKGAFNLAFNLAFNFAFDFRALYFV